MKNATTSTPPAGLPFGAGKDRADFVAGLGLPATTTDEELRIILQANVGESLPLKDTVFPALVEYVLASSCLDDPAARKFVADKFPTLARPAATGDEALPNNRPEFLTRLGLPLDTTDNELDAVLQANGGATLPLKSRVFTALLSLAMMESGVSEAEAREYVGRKFPGLDLPDASSEPVSQAINPLRAQLLALYNLPSAATDDDIAQAVAAVKNENIAEKARRSQEEADEELIAKKTSAGLTRDQAIKVIERQRHHDATLKRDQDARRPRLVEIIKSVPGDLRQARRRVNEEFPFLDGGEFNAAVTAAKRSTPAA